MQYGGYVYILTNKNRTTLYIGVTSQLRNRIDQHLTRHFPNSFSARYNLFELVYYEGFTSIKEAIDREKQLKHWNKQKKILLINAKNPTWNDLWDEIQDF